MLGVRKELGVTITDVSSIIFFLESHGRNSMEKKLMEKPNIELSEDDQQSLKFKAWTYLMFTVKFSNSLCG